MPVRFTIPGGKHLRRRDGVGNQFLQTARHNQRTVWYKRSYWNKAPFAVSKISGYPRLLLDRDVWGRPWSRANNNPEKYRWEKIINGMRVSEDRWATVAEDGAMHKVNWKMYCQRLEAELKASADHLPHFALRMAAVPMAWKKLEIDAALVRGLSVREAIAQCKLSSAKGHLIICRALESAQQGAETKGLDKEKLRLLTLAVRQGPTDKQIDLKSKGYHAWKTKKSSNLTVVVAEDPEMVLPDRSVIPFASVLTMRRAGLREAPTVLDVPAITAEGI